MTENHKRSNKTRDNQLKRHAAHVEKRRRPEDNKRLKQQRRARDAERGKQGPRRRRWDGDDDVESFERIRKRPGGKGAGRSAPSLAPNTGDVARDDSDLLAHHDAEPARVLTITRGRVLLDCSDGIVEALLPRELAAVQQTALAVGDFVHWEGAGDERRVVAVLPRRSELSRPDPANAHRRRVLAANIDIAVLVLSVKRPAFKPGLIDRFLIALEDGGVQPVVVANKLDLAESPAEVEALRAALSPYPALGVPTLLASAESEVGLDALGEMLAGRTSVFVGHSGVGKSSLLNALDPHGKRRTRSGREGDGKGRHTTTWSSLTELPGGTLVIDTPGVRAFGLWHLDPAALRAAFPELVAHGAGCRFGDCSHLVEPDCAVQAAVDRGEMSAQRFASYARIHASLGE